MARLTGLCLLAVLTSSCGWVASLETAVSFSGQARVDSTVFEPRLLGTWEHREDGTLLGRIVVTRTGPVDYRIHVTDVESDSTVDYAGIVAAFGTKRLLLELSTIDAAPRSPDSGRTREPVDFENPLLFMAVPIRMHIVVEQSDTGLRFFTFDADSLYEALVSGQLESPYWLGGGSTYTHDVLLTEREPDSVMSVLQRFAARPGALIPFPRIGHVVEFPSWK